MDRNLRDEVLSRLSEVETQLLAFNQRTLVHEPEMVRLLAYDIQKAMEGIKELTRGQA